MWHPEGCHQDGVPCRDHPPGHLEVLAKNNSVPPSGACSARVRLFGEERLRRYLVYWVEPPILVLPFFVYRKRENRLGNREVAGQQSRKNTEQAFLTKSQLICMRPRSHRGRKSLLVIGIGTMYLTKVVEGMGTESFFKPLTFLSSVASNTKYFRHCARFRSSFFCRAARGVRRPVVDGRLIDSTMSSVSI